MVRNPTIVAVTGVFVVTGFVISIAVVSFSRNKEKGDNPMCFTPECFHAASKILKDINTEVNPCDNFYEFACGGYLDSAPIPDGEVSIDAFAVVGTEIQNKLKISIAEPSTPDEPKAFTLAKHMYRTCMNTSALEKTGLEPIHKILRQLGKWPVLEGDNWKADNFDWVQSVYTCRKLGYPWNYFLSLGLWKNNTRYMLMLDQVSFGVGREYLADGIESHGVKAYYSYMVDIAVLLGANKERATRELKESLEFELKLVNISLPDEKRQNFTLQNNPMTVAELNKRYPSINWKEYINNLLLPTVQVDTNEVIVVKEPSFIHGLEKLIKETPKRIQANYVGWRVVSDSMEYLTANVRNRLAEYTAALRKVEVISKPRWSECLAIVSGSRLSIGTNALFIRKDFKADAKQHASEMVANIRNALLNILEKAEWMDKETRIRAMDKATAMIDLVAYPVELLDNNTLRELFASLELGPNDFLGNHLKLSQFALNSTLEKLRKPVNKTEWTTHEYSTLVNTVYHVHENSVQIPAGILQGMFFNKDRPSYMNYGAIGSLISHEMMHSFDTVGRQFDKDGSLVDWWTPETTQKYLEMTKCISNQYSNYVGPAVGRKVDGKITQRETIADNGGIKVAYFAYKEYAKKNGPEPKLPGLKYTPEQMFWISAANIRCTRYQREVANYELTMDVHSPERFRVIGPLSNMPAFSVDFKCPPGSNMNPVKKCSVI